MSDESPAPGSTPPFGTDPGALRNPDSQEAQSPPRLLRTLLTLALPAGIVGGAIRDDLDEEFAERAAMRSPDAARSWYRRQALGVFLRYALFRNLRRRLRLPAATRARGTSKPPKGTLGPDLTYALRALWRNPGFSAIAILTLALGIAATTATFSVVDTVIFRPLDLPDPNNVVQIWDQRPGMPHQAAVGVSWPDYEDYASHDEIFEHVGAVFTTTTYRQVEDQIELVRIASVTSGFLPLLGVEPFLGRGFLPGEDEWGSEHVAILSYHFWQREFGGDADVVGRTMSLRPQSGPFEGLVVPYTIVGVLPPDFRLPPSAVGGGGVWQLSSAADFLTSALGIWPSSRNRRDMFLIRVLARLVPGVTALQAQAAMDGVAAGIAERFPETHAGYRAVVVPLPSLIRETYGTGLYLLWGAAALVLLVAGANVANLLLSRGVVREQEMAVRAAMGAGRGRLLQQLLTESLLLGLAGGLVALPLASAGIQVLVASFPGRIFRLGEVSVDLRVLVFLSALSVVAGLLFGLWPAARSARPDLTAALKEGARGTAGTRLRSLRALVVVEMAAAVLLVTGAGLLFRTYQGLAHVDPGFNVENLLTLRVETARLMSKYTSREMQAALFDRVQDRLESLPGLVSVGGTTTPLLHGSIPRDHFTLTDRPKPPRDEAELGHWAHVAPGYLETLQVPLLSGRTLTEADAELAAMQNWVNRNFTMEEKREWLPGREQPVVVNQTMAQRYWPEEGALGKTLYWCNQDPEGVGNGEWDNLCPMPILLRIVGVVGDVQMGPLDRASAPIYYTAQKSWRLGWLAIRTSSDPLEMAELVRREIEAVDSELTVSQVGTMEARLASLVTQERFRMLLVGVFAAVATLLAAVGLFGVMAYAVSRRTHEIGVRISLGARHEDVLRLIGGQGMGLVVLGAVLGLLGAAVSTRYLASLLYGVTPLDPPTYLASAVLLIAVAGAACWLPTSRAIRVDPVEALRSE